MLRSIDLRRQSGLSHQSLGSAVSIGTTFGWHNRYTQGEIGRAVWADGGNEAQFLFVDHASHIVCQDTHRASFIAVSASAARLEISRLEAFIALGKPDPGLLPARPY